MAGGRPGDRCVVGAQPGPAGRRRAGVALRPAGRRGSRHPRRGRLAAGGGPAMVSVAAAPVAAATCFLFSRLATELSAGMLTSRRSRETSAALGVLAAGLAIPVVVTLGSLGLEGALEK